MSKITKELFEFHEIMVWIIFSYEFHIIMNYLKLWL